MTGRSTSLGASDGTSKPEAASLGASGRTTSLRHYAAHVNWWGVAILTIIGVVFYRDYDRAWVLVPLLAVAVALVALRGHEMGCRHGR